MRVAAVRLRCIRCGKDGLGVMFEEPEIYRTFRLSGCDHGLADLGVLPIAPEDERYSDVLTLAKRFFQTLVVMGRDMEAIGRWSWAISQLDTEEAA